MSPDELKEAQKKANDLIKAIYDDKEAEINGRIYTFTVMSFNERRTVFAYTSKIMGMLSNMDLSFVDDKEFKDIERDIIYKRVSVDDVSLSTKNVLHEHPEDYILFVTTVLQVISYPFLRGPSGG